MPRRCPRSPHLADGARTCRAARRAPSLPAANPWTGCSGVCDALAGRECGTDSTSLPATSSWGVRRQQAPAHRGVSPRLFRRSRISARSPPSRDGGPRGHIQRRDDRCCPGAGASVSLVGATCLPHRRKFRALAGYVAGISWRAVASVGGRALSAVATGIRRSRVQQRAGEMRRSGQRTCSRSTVRWRERSRECETNGYRRRFPPRPHGGISLSHDDLPRPVEAEGGQDGPSTYGTRTKVVGF